MRDARLLDSRFQGADLRAVDMGGITLDQAMTLKGAIISKDQASSLLAGFGLQVL
jgi:uncharacterized protein YjbI with pentapeptide repeats